MDAVNPSKCENVWAESFNDRRNWQSVQKNYPVDSDMYQWFTDAYSTDEKNLLSKYATDIYLRLRDYAEKNGWMNKFKYLLYESDITKKDAERLGDFSGILFQSIDKDTGLSKNPVIKEKQTPVDSAALTKVKELGNDVKSELTKHHNSWVPVGMKVCELVKSIEDDKNITWKSAFGVKDLKQFCEKQLDEKYKYVLRVKMAARCLKENRPKLYEAYLKDQTTQIPAYSVIYAVECKRDALKKNNKYNEMIKNLFDNRMSRNQIENEIGKLLPEQISITNSSTDKPTEELSAEEKLNLQNRTRKHTIPNLVNATDLTFNEIDGYFDTAPDQVVKLKADFNELIEKLINLTNECKDDSVDVKAA